MKAIHTEDFYRKYWNEFIEPTIGDDYMNLEGDLNKEMECFKGLISEDAFNKIAKVKAQEIANKRKASLLKTMKMLKDIEEGKASYGMVVEWQERDMNKKTHERFDFNCLQLADFRKKYELV